MTDMNPSVGIAFTSKTVSNRSEKSFHGTSNHHSHFEKIIQMILL